MKTNVAASWCLAAYLCGCAHTSRPAQTVVPGTTSASSETARSNVTLAQRADRFAGRLREKAAQMPTRAQGVLDTMGDSQLVTCLIPVLVVGAFVGAILSGGPVGSFNFCPPAPPSS
jgi:hypothetical protein